MRPEDPDAFVLPDLTVKFHEIDSGPEADARKRLEIKAQGPGRIRDQGHATSTPSPNCSRPTAFTNWTFITWSKTAR